MCESCGYSGHHHASSDCIDYLKNRLALLERVAEAARAVSWVFVCRCHPDYKRIGRHEPNAICGEDEDLRAALSTLTPPDEPE